MIRKKIWSMSGGLITLSFVGLGMIISQISAQEPSAPAKTGPGNEEVVEVNVGKLNLRAGEGTTYPIIKSLKQGDTLIVVSEKKEWVEVRFPDDTECWVTKKYVEITNKDTKEGVTKVAKMNVRSTPEIGENIIGNLKEGQIVQIKTEKGEWYQIAPTETLTGWVNKKYTRYWGTKAHLDEIIAKQRESELAKKELADKFEKAEKMYTAEQEKAPLSRNYTEILGLYREIINKPADKALTEKCDARIKQIEPIDKILKDYAQAVADGKEKIEKIEKEANEKLAGIIEKVVEPPAYDARGWVDGEGKYIGRPAAHILTNGGKTIFFLKSTTINLDDYFGQFVGVKGKIVDNKPWQAKTIIVDKIDVLSAEEGEPQQK